ncbi:MAG TPA: glycosyltransferase family 2 protein [Verrucomicrobiae bacterium]|nr:glycosyltransferase family 2 protein [Verrucomicrobiae bacterium]
MTLQEQITPLILTYNEAPNIRRMLEKLAWAREIVVLDSFSTDETLEIARSFPQVQAVQRPFDSFARQCNFGLSQIRTEWVLSLDADYVISDELNHELAHLVSNPEIAGYRVPFTYCIHGRPLRATLYPPRTVLYRRMCAAYHDEGHGHRVAVKGRVISLRSPIFHDDRKPLDRWLSEQNRYSLAEAQHLLAAPVSQLNRADRIRRKIVLAPALVFFHTLLGKGLILDGWPGWYYVFQRTYAELLLALRLLEEKMENKSQARGATIQKR